MNRILDKALTQALQGSPEHLEEFGLERVLLAGAGIPGAGPEWEERFSLTGSAVLSLSTRRSMGDLSFEPIGKFQLAASREMIRGVIQQLRDARLDEVPPCQLGVADAKIRVTVAAGGILQQVSIGTQDAAAAPSIQPLLQELDRLAGMVRASGVRTMRLNLSMPYHLRAAVKMRLQVALEFQNTGDEGYWVTHPGAMERSAPWERCSLLFGRKAESASGMPVSASEIYEVALEPAHSGGLDLFWVGGESETEQSFTATLVLPAPGTYVARAVYSSYAGEDQVGGQPRMRGCVFSNEVEIEAS
jgi:hypothetical protein